jgi:uncharacterized protein YuzE
MVLSERNHRTAYYDEEKRALYISLAKGRVEHTFDISKNTIVKIDTDADGKWVGLEILLPVIKYRDNEK